MKEFILEVSKQISFHNIYLHFIMYVHTTHLTFTKVEWIKTKNTQYFFGDIHVSSLSFNETPKWWLKSSASMLSIHFEGKNMNSFLKSRCTLQENDSYFQQQIFKLYTMFLFCSTITSKLYVAIIMMATLTCFSNQLISTTWCFCLSWEEVFFYIHIIKKEKKIW